MIPSLISGTAYSVVPLSPVHVGTEDRLGPHDVITVNGTLHRMNIEALLQDLEGAPDARDRYVTSGLPGIAHWLQQGTRLARLSLYTCRVPRDPRPREETRPFAADPLGRPYIPGTELKGAIRIAFLWHLIQSQGSTPRLRGLIGRRKKGGVVETERDRAAAGRWLAQEVLGEDPHHDLLRVLRVFDTHPAPSSAIRVHPVVVAARHGRTVRLLQRPRTHAGPSQYTDSASQALATFCECLEGATLQTHVEMDQFLLSKWNGKASAVTSWADACTRFSRRIAETEADWWAGATAPPSLEPLRAALVDFYRKLLRRIESLQPGQAVVNLGWGGGWRTKTVTELLGDDIVQDVVSRYKLDRGSHSRPFPKTRKVAWLGRDGFAPLGWVLMTPRPARR